MHIVLEEEVSAKNNKVEEEMTACAKVDITGELLATAMHKLKVDDASREKDRELYNEVIEQSKLNFEDILLTKILDNEIDQTAKLMDEELVSGAAAYESKERSEADLSDPIFDGAQITLATSILLVMTFGIRCSLSGVAIADLLLLISLHCGVPNL